MELGHGHLQLWGHKSGATRTPTDYEAGHGKMSTHGHVHMCTHTLQAHCLSLRWEFLQLLPASQAPAGIRAGPTVYVEVYGGRWSGC